MEQQRHTPHVTVGFDGSPGSLAALRFAVDEARRRAVALRVVTVWEFPTTLMMGVILPPDFPQESAAAARRAAQEAIDDLGNTGIPIEIAVTDGSASATLVGESRTSEVLVVGSRGHGAFADLVLGSVSLACTQYAVCPVVVIPHDRVAPKTPRRSVATSAA